MRNKLTYKEMQEMLPDYIFENLTISEAEIFEQNLPEFPDLQQEIADAKNVFAKVDKMDLKQEMDTKSRNISVKVAHKMQVNKTHPRLRTFSKLVLPTTALAILIAMIFLYDDPMFNSSDTEIITENQQSIDEIFALSSAEKLALSDALVDVTNTNEESLAGVYSAELQYDSQSLQYLDDELESVEDRTLSEKVNSVDPENLKSFMNTQINFGKSIINEIEELNEDEFRELLEDIENEKFI